MRYLLGGIKIKKGSFAPDGPQDRNPKGLVILSEAKDLIVNPGVSETYGPARKAIPARPQPRKSFGKIVLNLHGHRDFVAASGWASE
jgi:hypothetical protein